MLTPEVSPVKEAADVTPTEVAGIFYAKAYIFGSKWGAACLKITKT